MERYQLQSDETVLYEGEVIKVDKYKKESFMDSFSTPPTTELILTNKNIVLTHTALRTRVSGSYLFLVPSAGHL